MPLSIPKLVGDKRHITQNFWIMDHTTKDCLLVHEGELFYTAVMAFLDWIDERPIVAFAIMHTLAKQKLSVVEMMEYKCKPE